MEQSKGKKHYEEKQKHGTPHVPIGLHKLQFPEGTETIFYPHWHQEFELLVVTEGEALFEIDGREYTVHAGEGIFINSHFLHAAKSVEGKACKFFAVDFAPGFLNESLQSRFAFHYILPVINGKILFSEYYKGEEPWQSRVIMLLKAIAEYPEHALEPYELMLKSRIYEIWSLFFHNAEKKQGREDLKMQEQMQRLQPVLRYIEENYSYEIMLADLAELIPMSEGQFCRVFKKAMQMSPTQYLMRYRIMQSCRYLIETDKKIAEIANLSGFNNSSYFNKIFLQTIGCTPKEYREDKNNFTF